MQGSEGGRNLGRRASSLRLCIAFRPKIRASRGHGLFRSCDIPQRRPAAAPAAGYWLAVFRKLGRCGQNRLRSLRGPSEPFSDVIMRTA